MSQFDSPPMSGNGQDAVPDPIPTTSSSVGTPSDAPASAVADVAGDRAKQVGRDAVDAGRDVAQSAVAETSSVVQEAGTQVQSLLTEARSQLNEQASVQQSNAAGWLHSIADELHQMVERSSDDPSAGQPGPATSLVRQVASEARRTASWLENHEPADLLTETSRFARKRPGLFLALAAAAGLLAGRLTRGLTADSGPSDTPRSITAVDNGSGTYPPVITPTSGRHADQPLPMDTSAVISEGLPESEPAWDVR